MRKRQIVLLLVFLYLSIARPQSSHRDLKTLLQDSSDFLNSFDEEAERLTKEIDSWNVPPGDRQSFKDELGAVVAGVNSEKPHLARLLNKDDVPAGELFDVYSSVSDSANELYEQAESAINYSKPDKRNTERIRLASKAEKLSLDLRWVLRTKIADQEFQIAWCPEKIPAPSAPKK